MAIRRGCAHLGWLRPRWGSFHYGLDFTPGEGAEIQAVAAGTVREANESGGAFGVHVIIDHEINGEVFSTHYAHMLYGSLQVKPGDSSRPVRFSGTSATRVCRTERTCTSRCSSTAHASIRFPGCASTRRLIRARLGFWSVPRRWYSLVVARLRVRPDSSVVEHFHGKEGVVSSILTRGSQHP